MAWGNRSGYVVFGIAVCGVFSSGGCSDDDAKSRPQCGPGETRVCVQQGVSEQCSCHSGNTGGSGPQLDGGGGRGGGAPAGSGPGGSDGSGGSAGGRPIIDGALGGGGSLGSGAFGGTAGGDAAGSGGAPGTGRLGAACTSNVDCGAGLTCIAASSSALNGEGPAGGLCSASCAGDAGVCTRFGADAVCLNFGSLIPALYCVQGCTFGPVGSNPNPNKCNARDEVACGPLFGATGAACTTDANCAVGELCGDGQCFSVIPACLPQCNADSDCGTGRYCNPQTGLCGATPKAGLPLGEECTQPPAGGTDACRGNCIGLVLSAGGPVTASTCTENCTIGALPSCGWSGPTSGTPAPGLCLFSSTVIGDRGGPGPGDRGSCAQLCNCNADCLHSSLVCIPIGEPNLESATRRRGFCTVPDGNPGIPCP